eukprot:COSAG01_NODE_42747_length_437_cov_0.497041_1_plen_84_part_01
MAHRCGGSGVLSECARCEGEVQGAVNTAPFLTLPDREKPAGSARLRPGRVQLLKLILFSYSLLDYKLFPPMAYPGYAIGGTALY